nr:SdpI family protein [Clostridia bacterium]
MIKKNLKLIIITTVISLLPMAVGLILWDKLPDTIATHFGLNGEADGWSSKATAVLFIPLFITALHLVCAFATSLDPKNKNIDGKPFTLVLWITPTLSVLVCTLTYLIALGYNVSMNIVMPLFMSVLFIIIGNYLPKCKPNYTIGIKIMWTLNDEENWNKTHRFAGKLWVVCGIVTGVVSLFIPWFFFVTIAVMVFAPVIYSYILYRKKK